MRAGSSASLETVEKQRKAHLGVARLDLRGEKHGMWVGDNCSYRTMHRRLQYAVPKTDCEFDDDTCIGKLEYCLMRSVFDENLRWSPDGNAYSVRIEDYQVLCHSHHRRYDSWTWERILQVTGGR